MFHVCFSIDQRTVMFNTVRCCISGLSVARTNILICVFNLYKESPNDHSSNKQV